VEARTADIEWQVDASSVLLFRYSAMTFNGHRFHYDHPYATGVEGYAGLVVHGPLQATLLYNIAAVLGGQVPSLFRYRGIRPLIAGQTFKVRGARTEQGLECWTEDARGRICLESHATFRGARETARVQ
jgi:3-methylfumaryl-CoA hydratase